MKREQNKDHRPAPPFNYRQTTIDLPLHVHDHAVLCEMIFMEKKKKKYKKIKHKKKSLHSRRRSTEKSEGCVKSSKLIGRSTPPLNALPVKSHKPRWPIDARVKLLYPTRDMAAGRSAQHGWFSETLHQAWVDRL